MKQVTLLPLDLRYANVIFELSSNPHVKNALGIKVESVEDTKAFILFAIGEERKKHSLSRVIVSEENEIIGLTTLKHINYEKKHSHIGSWLGYQYWGRGYNESAKKEIFKIAFLDLQLTYVFAGAKTTNIRSLKAQEKLHFITCGKTISRRTCCFRKRSKITLRTACCIMRKIFKLVESTK